MSEILNETLNYEVLAAQVNTKFALTGTDEPFELELVEVTEPTVTTLQTYFSAYFLGNEKLMLPQGTYEMNHASLGKRLFFLVPSARVPEGFKYEAVFNLLN